MKTGYFSSLLFALLASVSVAVTAAPATESMSGMARNADAMGGGAATMQGSMAQERINLNSADAATLQKELIGIGKNKADAIVAYREANGQFTSVDELVEVKGIGKAILDKNRDRLTVE